MFSTCLFCRKSLGDNEVIEHLPIGRRVAFDPNKGRLWVVCRHCERWNLTPFEDRWEALEECERIFRGARLRQSTDNIGLAKVVEGLELVRIGEPLRPEFAAWRYGDQFGRRRRRMILYGIGGVAAVGAVVGGAAIAGVSIGIWPQFPHLWMQARTAAKIRTPEGKMLKVQYSHLPSARLISGTPEYPWSIALKHAKGKAVFEGEEALRVAGLLLPKVNRSGANAAKVQDAVGALERAGGPEAFLSVGTRGHVVPAGTRSKKGGALQKLPTPTRLALEMALHEEQERRALAGELKVLEAAWQEAEEIAAIADRMFVSDDTKAQLARLGQATPPN